MFVYIRCSIYESIFPDIKSGTASNLPSLNFIKKIIDLFGRKSGNLPSETNTQAVNDIQISTPEDEIVGLWENDLDDGSGLHAIWGWSYKFNKDGTGVYYSWSQSKPDDEIPFRWERVSANTIKAKYPDDETWDMIEYTLQIVPAPYAGSLMKLTDNSYTKGEMSREGFWSGYGAVFRHL